MLTPYQRTKNGNYYFKYTASDGKRIQRCTGTRNYDEAVAYVNRYQEIFKAEPRFSMPTVLEELRKYQDPKTNPKYQQCILEGGNYSEGWAIKVSKHTQVLEELMTRRQPTLLTKRLDEVQRIDIANLTRNIALEKGQSRSAQMLQQAIKVLFSQAYQSGYINTSPAAGIKNIKHKMQKRTSIPAEYIQEIISNRKLFSDTQAWAYFVVLATTGMRKNEVLALSTKQIDEGYCLIDSCIKGTGKYNISLPKWGIVRSIPLPKITQEALAMLKPVKDKEGNFRYFLKDSYWVQGLMDVLRAGLRFLCPGYDFSQMTSHTLRHSCNTNLLVRGADPTLLAEFLAWEHQQEICDMQRNYMHIVAKDLQPIADAIDNMYHL